MSFSKETVRKFLILFGVLWFFAPAGAADPGAELVRESVRSRVKEKRLGILKELIDLVAIPNQAADRENILRNAEFIELRLRTRGISTRRLEVEGSPPVLFGELKTPGAKRTVVMYAHYDGQPVDPDRWTGDPYSGVVRDPSADNPQSAIQWWMPGARIDGEVRMYGRSVSDDKAPIVALLTAIDALRWARIPLSVNLKVFLEGEEEIGSPHLAEILRENADLLKADLWLICDGPVHQSRKLQLFFGNRGVIGLEMTVYGPTRPLHSGHYGNWAPNPIALLSQLLADMRLPDGEIDIRGFADQVRKLTKTERKALDKVPDLRESLMEDLGLAWTEGGGASLERLIMRPAMNIRGFQAGNVEELARNAIPTQAKASIDFRLVPDQTPEFIRAKVEDHIRARGFHLVFEEPDPETRRKYPKIVKLQWDHGYPPYRAPMDLPVARSLVRILEEATGEAVIELPTLGGSGPVYLFEEILATPAIGVPIVNHDNNQHAADENLRLQNYWDGIEIYAAILARLGALWDQ